MPPLEFRALLRRGLQFTLDVEFSLAGGVAALFGPSGSGKTTILSLLAGVVAPERGRIAVGSPPRVLFDSTSRISIPIERRRVAMVFQERALFPHMTVRRNLQYGQPRDIRSRDDFDRIVSALEVSPFLDRRPSQLSGGQRQRLELGRAVLSRPEWLLLDEPVTALDADLRRRVLAEVRSLSSEWGFSALIVSHQQAELWWACDHVVCLDAGRVVHAGPTRDVWMHADEAFASDPSGVVNVIPGDGFQEVAGEASIVVAGHRLLLPHGISRGGVEAAQPPRFVSIAARHIVLARSVVSDVSVRNQIPGVVRQIRESATGRFVAVELGEQKTHETPPNAGPVVWVELTTQAVESLGLRTGESVVCLIKTQSISVV
jgi:molybdate transport system ATP-binding protein